MTHQRTDLRVSEVARRREGVLSAAELQVIGLDRHAVRRRVSRGILWEVHQGVFAFGTPDISRRGAMRAAVLTCGPEALVSHAAAAELWGLIDDRAVPVDVLVGSRRPRRPSLCVHRTNWLPPFHRAVWHGLPVTSVARTLLDAGTGLAAADHELAIASALRRRLAALDELESLAATGRPGAAALGAVLALAGGPQFTRSKAERILLALVRDAHLPPPEANATVFGAERDLVWREQQVIAEFDGFAFHWSPDAKARDAMRDGDLTVRGWRTVRLGWRELTEAPNAVVARLAATLAIPPVVRTAA